MRARSLGELCADASSRGRALVTHLERDVGLIGEPETKLEGKKGG